MSNANLSNLTQEQLIALLAQRDAELVAKTEELSKAKAEAAKPLGIKITEKGGISVYGLGRFPVTLYRKQWGMLFGRKEEIEKVIADNESKLSALEDQHKSKPLAKAVNE